jgi:hypothetical protein
MTASSLSLTADRSSTQLRPGSTQDNWGGDETVTLSVLDDDLVVRVEWSEGKSADWDIWCFDHTASFETGDILLFEDADLTLALVVTRFASFTTLRRKSFHHWEVLCEEHELSVAELKTEAGI